MASPSALDPDQRSRLLAAKLRALVESRVGVVAGARPVAFPGGAALVSGDTAWVLIEDRPQRALGPALAWAAQQGATRLHVLVDDAGVAAALARRAATFTRAPDVWAVVGRALQEAPPAPVASRAVPPPAAFDLLQLLEEADVEVVVEHGEVRGEVLGLEIARIVVTEQGTARVEVGVGRHDREAFTMLHGDLPPAEALRSVVETVRRHRRAGADAHPLNRLARERWLRRRLLDEPSLVGAVALRPEEGTVVRRSVKDVVPAVAVGDDTQGRPLVVVCSTGIDLDLVPTAADARLAHDPEARLLLVVPERDAHPVTRRLAAALRSPAELLAVPGDWTRPAS
ncbi:MAG: hypothetical protein MUF83_01935 [Acidimicrobiales bacterium]|nr:hypothetical protein [Acidimicrobiales bacterium]